MCYTNLEVIDLNTRKRAAVVELLAFDTTTGRTKKMTVDGRDFYSLSYRYYGKISIKADDKELISEANSITFMPKNISYETEIIEDTRMAVAHFKLDEDIDFRNPVVISLNDRSVRSLFEKLIESYRVDRPMDLNCMSIFYQLLARLEALTLTDSREHISQKIRAAKEYMLQGYTDPLFSISLLADLCKVSTAYLRREFSRAYGMSPVSFLRDLRIENAKNLLQSEYLTISEIAEQSGFSSASYFIQVFHKTVGESPDRYRQRNQLKSNR